jgi:hypothetical protein
LAKTREKVAKREDFGRALMRADARACARIVLRLKRARCIARPIAM